MGIKDEQSALDEVYGDIEFTTHVPEFGGDIDEPWDGSDEEEEINQTLDEVVEEIWDRSL